MANSDQQTDNSLAVMDVEFYILTGVKFPPPQEFTASLAVPTLMPSHADVL